MTVNRSLFIVLLDFAVKQKESFLGYHILNMKQWNHIMSSSFRWILFLDAVCFMKIIQTKTYQ